MGRGPSESDLYLLFDRSPTGMYRATRDGRFLYVNPALARMLGYSVEEMLQLNSATDLYTDPHERERLIAEHLPNDSGSVGGLTVAWKHRDGHLLTVRIHGHVVDGEHGKYFDASVVDLSDLELASAELRRQRAELERTAQTLDMVVNQASAMWWRVDRDLRIVEAGGRVLEIMGYPPEKNVGKRLPDILIRRSPDTDPSMIAHVRALAGETVRYVNDYKGKLLENTIAPYGVNGEIVGAIGTSVDVTAVRALERRMVDAQRAESLGVLAGGLAHDFNNLLAAILGNADLGLREVPPGGRGRESLENIRQASLRAAELTDQLLAYAGRGGTSSLRIDPGPLVEELLRISASQMLPNVAISVDIPSKLALLGDPAQVRQVLFNLIGNARDAIGERPGIITISARSARSDGNAHPDDVITAPAGTYVVIEVADTGMGMDGETRRRIFEPFFTTKPTGHGLGLAAVLGIIRAHGGGLRLESAAGSGSRFQVLWPAADAPAPVRRARGTARTVLVIDDEAMIRDVVARMIEDLGYTALTAADGASGVTMATDTQVDVVLVDLTMPQMSGAEVIAALRARHPRLPVVLCSGYDRDHKGPVQADAFLPKPFRMDALADTLARILGPGAAPEPVRDLP